jgi:hypothetical protein
MRTKRNAERGAQAMIDTFALLLSHTLLALTAWRLVRRPDLDHDAGVERPRTAWGRRSDA